MPPVHIKPLSYSVVGDIKQCQPDAVLLHQVL